MDNKFKGKIIIALRKLSFQWKPRSNVKNRAKVQPNLFACEKCNTLVYEGTSDKNFKQFDELYSDKFNVIKGKIHMDHIIHVVNPSKEFTTWDDFINLLFCSDENFQAICATFHMTNTKIEPCKKHRESN